jgi:nickel-dependent lactate racemase
MLVQLPWGKGEISIRVPDTWKLHYPARDEGFKIPQVNQAGEIDIVRKSLDKPVKMKPIFGERLKGARILIIVDDNTRPTPVSKFFHLILDDMKRAGADLKNITVVPALGIHTPMSREEMEAKIGDRNMKKIKWENHSAFDVTKLQFMGRTKRGTPVMLNNHVSEADYIVLVGMVEPHIWAGFGGGMKNIFPGVASAESIGAHHSVIAEPPYLFNRVGMTPESNSFRQELEEIREMIQARIFCLNLVIGRDKNIIAAFSGDPIACHREAVKMNNKISGLRLDHKVDGIIVNSFPMDINFKQSMKGIGNSLPALKKGGTVMAFLRAERGLDDINLRESSIPLWLLKIVLRSIGPSRVMGLLEFARKGLDVEEKFLVYYGMQLIREYDIFGYVPSLTPENIKKVKLFTGCYSPQDVIDLAARNLGPDAEVAVFPEAGATYPIVG